MSFTLRSACLTCAGVVCLTGLVASPARCQAPGGQQYLNAAASAVTTSQNYSTDSGLTINLALPVDLFLVGGGGGVGGAVVDSAWMGGGGGGEVKTATGVQATLLSNAVTVGSGGAANALAIGATGATSTALGLSAAGGGGGGATGTGRGGSSGSGTNTGGVPATSPLNGRAGGGGGGQVTSGSAGLNSEVGGAGGTGAMSTITGTNQMYGFGGGGASRLTSGVNGDGTATAPRANSGGGGWTTTAGAAGIVVIRYPGAQAATGGTVSTVGGDTIHTFVSSGSFTLGDNLRATLSGVISGSGGFTFNAPGTLALTAANTYTGTTTINGGTLQIGTGVTTGSLGTGNVVNRGTLAINRGDAYTLANAITGTGSVIKMGAGVTTLTGSNGYTGATTVAAGRLAVNGSLASGLITVQSGATLGGAGFLGGTIGGAGTVAPGNSPGILTAASVDPSAGLDFTFEFSGTAPNYLDAAASVNDVLRLTASTPFASALSAANTMTLFLNMTQQDLALGTVLQGGFFTDADVDFLSLINNGGFAVYVKGDGNGTDNTYNGQGYYNWRNPAMFGWTQSLFASTEAVTADFAGGSSTGQVLTLTVAVPEPSTYAMALAGIACGGFSMWRRRKRA